MEKCQAASRRGVVDSKNSGVPINLYFLLGHGATKNSSSSGDSANIEGIISSIDHLLDDLGHVEVKR